MSARGSKRVSYSPDVSDHKTIIYQRQVSGKSPAEKPKGSVRNCKRVAEKPKECFGGEKLGQYKRLGGFSAMRTLKSFGDKMATAIRFVFKKKKKEKMKKKTTPPKGASSGKSKPFIAPVDSHRSEAIADCIEFINTSSLQRSSSVSANSH